MRVLLAEDNAVNQRVAVGLLERRGHHVTVAGSGAEALAALDGANFDVVLMDVQMPDMDGIEATTTIRAREARTGLHQRILAMTAHAMTGDRERCMAAGMDGYLSKPVDPDMLYAAVEQGHSSAGKTDPTPARPLPVPVDLVSLARRLGNDEALIADVVQLFLRDCPQRLTAIRAAIDAADATALRAAAHGLKGSAANLSAGGLCEAARTLERLGAEGRLQASEAAWRSLASEAAMALDCLRTSSTVFRQPLRNLEPATTT
jgi:two-component system sensor histidine kinase/response regulator